MAVLVVFYGCPCCFAICFVWPVGTIACGATAIAGLWALNHGIQGTQDAINSQSRSSSNECDDDDDECRQRENEMRSLAQEINGRSEDMLIDKCNQYFNAFDSPNPNFFIEPRNTCGGYTTWRGHERQLEGKQNRLRKLIRQAKKRGCNVPSSAWKAAWRGIPKHPRGLSGQL